MLKKERKNTNNARKFALMQGFSKNKNLSTQRPWDKVPRCLEELKGGQCISRGKGWEREGWAKFV